jgi:hypothetical protein
MRGPNRGELVLFGAIGGIALGFLAWSRVQRLSRRDLFSTQPVRRYAALGYLRSCPTIETVHLLREYVAWESKSALRRRGVRMLREMEASIR